jgi:uncharacterized membrane protein YdjX (TVP38/TMEM64 family)
MNKWLTGFIYLAIILIFFIYKNEILHWMQVSQAPIYIVFLIAMCFALVPIMPYKIVIGTLGFIYGPFLGAFISWAAAMVASVIIFLLVRYYFQKQGSAYFAKFERLEKLQKGLEKNPFLTILVARLIPVIPQSIVNIYPAITSIRLLTYVSASALGKIPSMLIFAFIGQNLLTDMHNLLISISVYVIFFLITYGIYRLWLKDKLI